MKDVLMAIVCLILICAFIWCTYWLYKTGSYFFFYEGFVTDTIKELVNA